MSNSLKDQLLGLGFSAPKPEPRRNPAGGKPGQHRPAHGKPATGKPGTGLGLAIVRDVAAIYGGSVSLSESEDLGGLMVRLRLPSCPIGEKEG